MSETGKMSNRQGGNARIKARISECDDGDKWLDGCQGDIKMSIESPINVKAMSNQIFNAKKTKNEKKEDKIGATTPDRKSVV